MLVGICWLFSVATCEAAMEPRDLAEEAAKFLLPGNIVPVHYDLKLFTNIEKFQNDQPNSFQFSGDVAITVNVLADNISNIILHFYDDMTVNSVSISTIEDNSSLGIQPTSYDSETQKLVLTVSQPLKKNKLYNLSISYTGINNHDLEGFYRASYNSASGTRWLLVTQLEFFGARRAFPSFDEPKYKATYQVTIDYNQTLADDGYVAYSNTDVESELISGGRHITKFQKTPLPHSSYLVAFLLSDFKVSPEPTYFNSSYNGENGTKAYRTIGQPRYFEPRSDLLSQVAGPALLNYMTKKLNIGFGYRKLDQVGVPEFASGAMENWGLPIYRESLLFWNEEKGSTADMQEVTMVIAHELSHQWFGNLVTLHWWTDLWLNEGFATYFQFHAVNQIREPTLDTSSWDSVGQFVDYYELGFAYLQDCVQYSVPLTYENYSRDKNITFTSISYYKGGAVIRMWQHILGEDLFYSGLHRYLNTQRESVATPELLLASWDHAIQALPASEHVLPANVSVLFKEWHTLVGFPILTVKRQGADLVIRQERFFYPGINDSSSNKWSVPISYSTDLENNFNNTKPISFLLPSQDNITITLKFPNASWYILDNQATGYFVVKYDEDNRNVLENVINNPETVNQIHPYNVAKIFFFDPSYQSYSSVLRLLKSLRHQRSLVVWRAGLTTMNHLLAHLEAHEETNSLLKTYLSWVVEPAFNELGLSVKGSEAHTKKLLRVDVAKMACLLQLPACRQQTADIFASRSAHPDVQELVLCERVKNGGTAVWETVLKEALQAHSPVKKALLNALTCTSVPSLLNRLGEIMTRSGSLSIENKMNIITAAAHGGRQHTEFALKMLAEQKLKNDRDISKIVAILMQKLSGPVAADLMKPISRQAAEIIIQRTKWFEEKLPEISEWLKANKPDM